MLGRGEVLGGYRIDDVVGIGGMAIVYRAEQLSLGRTVALKVLAPQLSRDEAFQERFRREGRHAAALDHPNVVTIYDFGEALGRLYLAMALVDGTTLAQRLLDSSVSPDAAVSILGPIASALDAAHRLGLVHRDIKPQNILLVGRVHYASPEQIRGDPATARSDVYALTAVLYHCLTGEPPYAYEGDAAVMHAHLHAPPPGLLPRAPDTERVARVVARGMAKDPCVRYQRAGELLDDAAAAVAALPSARRTAAPGFTRDAALERRPPTVEHRRGATRRPGSRGVGARRRGAAAVAVLAAGGVATAVILLVAGSGPARHGGGVRGRSSPGASSGPLRLRLARTWRPAPPFAVGASAIASPISLRSAGATLIAGPLRQPPQIAAGIPPALARQIGSPATRGAVRIAAGLAHRYTWLLPGG